MYTWLITKAKGTDVVIEGESTEWRRKVLEQDHNKL